MNIIPVLDLMQGVVVHGVAGQRDSYQPIHSGLTTSCDPVEVAGALCRVTDGRLLYVADLDALMQDRPDWDTLQQLVEGGYELIVDAGVRDVMRASELLRRGVDRVVVALETAPHPAVLQDIISGLEARRLTFSLDLRNGRPLVTCSDWGSDPMSIATRVVERGIRSLIVLDIAGVGVAGGVPTLPICLELRERFADIELITGGGVRGGSDLQELDAAGLDGVLVASALHSGCLGAGELARWRGPESHY